MFKCVEVQTLVIPRAQIISGSRYSANTQTLMGRGWEGGKGPPPAMRANLIIIKMKSKPNNFSKELLRHLFPNYLTTRAILHSQKVCLVQHECPHPSPTHPQTSYSGKRKHRLRDAGSPERNVLTAGPYPQPGKSLIYNPTQETTGKQQEVIFKEPVATGSECRGSKHVPIKVRQLQKNHKGSGHGWGRGRPGEGAQEEEEEGGRKTSDR